jgi:hypothetical protein
MADERDNEKLEKSFHCDSPQFGNAEAINEANDSVWWPRKARVRRHFSVSGGWKSLTGGAGAWSVTAGQRA